ncbi:MAG: sulfatase [Pirellulales bacterium]|nr:sulfatase [Pirellulales bacterium]
MLIERDRSECLTQCHLVVICCLVVLVSSVATGAPPNIVLILVDDMGYTGVGCFGNRHVATPNIDRLTTEGAKLTSAYVMPQCTPTRAALLTGQHTARTGMWHVPGYHFPYARVKEPTYVMGLPKESVTVAEVLRDRGYKTACIGKWHLHLGTDGNYGRLYEKSKKDHGFDVVQSKTDRGTPDKGVAMLTDEAINFIGRNRANPFFLYLSHYTVHTPVQATPARIAKYRQAGFPAAGPDQHEGRHNATYLAMIEELDRATGQLLDKLDEWDLARRTVVIFLSDNGGVLRVTDNGPLRWGKGSAYEGGIRVPMLVRWPGTVKPGTVETTPVHVTDIYPTLLEAAGAKRPLGHTLDGHSLAPLLTSGSAPERDALYWYMPLYDPKWGASPCAVIRQGKYKLIEYFGDYIDIDQGGKYLLGGRTELFNLRNDISERRNLANVEPERVQAMRQKLHVWIESMGRSIPGRNPDFDRQKALRMERLKPETVRNESDEG